MTDPTPIAEKAEYPPADPRTHLEQCPVCGKGLSPGRYSGRVYGPTGPSEANEYETLLESPPGDGPYYCEACWREHTLEVAKEQHRSLSEFGVSG